MVDTVRAQLRGHEPAEATRELKCGIGVEVKFVPDAACRRQQREAALEALHASAFLVDRNDERRCTRGVDVGAERGKLRVVNIIARKQDDAAHQRMAQELAVFATQLKTRHINHQGAEANAGRCRRAKDSTCIVWGNMSNTPAACKLKP